MASTCIISREYPMLFGYLVLALEDLGLDLNVVMDRRRAALRDRESGSSDGERRSHPEIEQALRVKGYAIVAPEGDPAGVRGAEIASRALAGITMRDEEIEPSRPAVGRGLAIAAATLGVGLVILMLAMAAGTGSALARVASDAMSWAWGSDGPAETALSEVARARELERPTVAVESPAPAADQTALAPPVAAKPVEAPAPPVATKPAQAPAPRVAARPAPAPAPAVAARPARAAAPIVAAKPAEAPLPRTSGSSPAGAVTTTMVAPTFTGLPRVELASQATGSGANRTLAYTVRLSDSGGRPLDGADVWLRLAMPDRTDRETRLAAATPAGTYRGRLAVGARTPEVLRVRIALGGTRVEIPVSQTP